MVELVALKVEAACHGPHGARFGLQGHEGTFDLGQLNDLPLVVMALHHTNHGAATNLLLGLCLL
jgi:hypothetical protein